ncbi:MAG: hypothetical protein VST67_03465, partial [Nitrospirota bacterium]|nr:hypothetical protein [Nitrospirota bacterium]
MNTFQQFLSWLKNRSWLRIVLVGSFILGCIGTGTVGGIIWVDTRDLPTFDSFQDYHPSLVSRVYADNGEI